MALFLVLGAGPAVDPVLASCAPPRPIEESMLLADVVVVGIVTQVENSGRWITVKVEERWRGPESLPETIRVRGGPEPGAATSVDRVFVQARYLLFLTGGPATFTDNACSATVVWTDQLAALRPAGVVACPRRGHGRSARVAGPGEPAAGPGAPRARWPSRWCRTG